MKIDITLKNISIFVAIVIPVGAALLGLLDLYISYKLFDVIKWQTATGAKMDMLLEERLVELEKGELYNRMNRILNRTDEENYSIDRHTPNADYETKVSEKK